MIKEIIVVEGKADTTAIDHAVGADTIETGGSAINREIMDRIRLAQERRGVIVFTDPDHAGERIRRLISEAVPGCKHAFLPRELAVAKNKKGIGVEHADPDVIRRALKEVKTEHVGAPRYIEWSDLMTAGLIAHPEASKRREIAGKKLGIGYANGKQFLKRCHMFQITRDEFGQAVKEWKELDS